MSTSWQLLAVKHTAKLVVGSGQTFDILNKSFHTDSSFANSPRGTLNIAKCAGDADRMTSGFKKCQQVGAELLFVCIHKSMRRPGIDRQRGVFDQLG
jgi:hypothetical protein